MEHWVWLALVALVLVLMSVTGCTIALRTNAAPDPIPTTRPAVTLTVREPVLASPTAYGFVGRVAAQPSPMPSPTPRVYTIRENDTLLDIALRFGISLDTLRAANPAIDPLTLQIGQRVIIPDSDTPIVAQPVLPALNLSPPTCTDTPTRTLLCLGLVRNPLDVPVTGVVVTLTQQNGDGETLAEQSVGIEQALVLPGDLAPYRAIFAESTEAVTVTLQAALEAPDVSAQFVALSVHDVQAGWEGPRYVLSTTVTNPTEETATSPRVVALVQNSRGQLVGYRVVVLDESIRPGEGVPVEVRLLPAATEADDLTHHLHVEARVAG